MHTRQNFSQLTFAMTLVSKVLKLHQAHAQPQVKQVISPIPESVIDDRLKHARPTSHQLRP